jgi:glycosyltransferase involved in cell wall biosynthesis
MKSPSIALCIPAYKAEEHLPRLLTSAEKQDPPFDEIIVCVDASPDRTAEVARAWGAKVLINERNEGCSASKNRAMKAASADWVHFHDADDLLLPDFTAEAHGWMGLDNPPDVVIMGFEYLDFVSHEHLATGLQNDRQLSVDPVGYAIRHKLPNFGIYQRNKILNLGGFELDPVTLYNEDVAFHLKLALAGLSFRASSKITSINYRHGDSMSSTNAVRCEVAHCEVMRRVWQKTGNHYAVDIAGRIWGAATVLASHRAWAEVSEALALAKQVFQGIPPGQSQAFVMLCRILGVGSAYRFREFAIRSFKPALRTGL